MAAGEQIITGPIGATQPELSRYILDNEELIEEAILNLQGYVKITNDKGEEVIKKIKDREYNYECISWMKAKLRAVLNKNTFLSQLDERDMYRVAGFMSKGFRIELFMNAKDFALPPNKAIELHNMYNDFLDLAIRRALNESDKRFFKETHSETTQRLDQRVTESQEKKGFMSRLLG